MYSIYIFLIHSASLLDWFNAVERTYAFVAEASFVVQHRAVLLRSKPSVKVRKLVKSGSPTCAFDLFCVCTHLFPPRCALRVFTPRFPQKLTDFPFFSRNSLVKTGLWTGSCHFISARFVVCDVHACVCLVFLLLCVCACVCVFLLGLCAPWLMHDMLPRVVEFGLIARPFLLVPPFDFSCLSAIFCNTVKYNVLAPFWSCLHPDLHAPAFLWLTADRIRWFLGGRSRPNIIALIPLQLTHFWAHYKFDMIAVAWTVAH